MLALGSQVGQITQEVKEYRFAKLKFCLHCSAETVSRNGKYKGNNDISVNLITRLLPTLRIQLLTRARKH